MSTTTCISTSPEGHAVQEITLDSKAILEFRAMNVRKERTGLHAHVVIFIHSKIVSHSTFNVFREEDRTRLCNAAHSLFNDLDKAAYSKEQFRHDFGIFSLDLEAWLDSQWVAQLLEPIPPATNVFILYPYILQEAGTILFSPPGKGKSFIALAKAVSIDAGVSDIWQVKQAPVLFVNLERSGQSFQRRLWQINQALGLDPQRRMLFINARGHTLADLGESIRESVLRHNAGIVFLDSISRAGMGSLVEDRTANAIVDTLNQLGVAWYATGHTPRADATHIYGAVHFEAGEDIGIRMVSQETPGSLGIGLEVVKANDLAKPKKAYYRLTFDDAGLTGILAAKDTDFPELMEQEQPNKIERIKMYILDQLHAEATFSDISKDLHLDKGNLSRTLANYPFQRLRSEGRKVFFGIATSQIQEPPF